VQKKIKSRFVAGCGERAMWEIFCLGGRKKPGENA
jgi:hypothetical protein